MDETLQEFVDSRGVRMRVDAQLGVIRGVKLLGLESRNSRRYLPQALERAAALYEGAKVNVNHPKGHPLAARDYEERLGVVRNVHWKAAEGLFGDLHFNPDAPAEQLAWDAEHAPQNVGLSHNVQARTARDGDQIVVEAILKVQSVDLVADPATTQGLFEHRIGALRDANTPAAVALETITEQILRSARPDLVQEITEPLAAEALAALRVEIEHLRLERAADERRGLATRLLTEFNLPRPGDADASASHVVGGTFFQGLLAAPNEQAMRALVAERAALVNGVRHWLGGELRQRPISREQGSLEPRGAGPHDSASFVKAISRK